ncbi:MAG: hypothetical protein JW852_05915 [Spirochaetales bacterium]|nr:hypothetical protein [Spirochaetales bacterium]
MSKGSLESWENSLKALFDEIDDEIEERFGALYDLHPARAKRGGTSNKEQDGLFNIGASFSAGFGSEHGRGYVLDMDMITLERVPDEVRRHIEALVVERIKEKLPRFFPGRELSVKRDGNVFKITGDLTLS